MVDQEHAVRIELLQDGTRGLRFPVPVSAPVHGGMPEDRPPDGKGIAADGAVLPDIADRFLLQFGNAGKGAAERFAPFPVSGEEGPVLTGPDGQFLVRIIHQETIPVEKIVQRLLCKSFYPGLQGQLGIFPADIHGIVLDAAGLADILKSTVFADKTVFSEQPLPEQDELPCLFASDGQHLILPGQSVMGTKARPARQQRGMSCAARSLPSSGCPGRPRPGSAAHPRRLR